MQVYIINFALIFYWWFIYSLVTGKKITPNSGLNASADRGNIFTKSLIMLPFVQIYLILALKNLTVGRDTPQYLTGYNMVSYISWGDIFNFDIPYIVFNFERGFIALSKAISLFTEDFTVYSAIVYGIMIFPLYKVIKKYSTMPFLSVILFITLGFLNFYFSGMRQSIAMSLVLLSYDFIVRRKAVKFFLLIIIAALFHQSALFFLPAYFVSRITMTPVVTLFYFSSLPIIYLLRTQIFTFFTQFFYSSKEVEDTGAYTLLFIVFTAFIVGMYTYKRAVKMNSNNKVLYNLIAIAAALMIFNTVSNIGLRVANYYYMYMILFIPAIVTSYKGNLVRFIASFVVIAFTSTYYLMIGVNSLSGNPYAFFWH